MQNRFGSRALQLMVAIFFCGACGTAPTQTPIPTVTPTTAPTRRVLPPTFTPEAFATVTPFPTLAADASSTPIKSLPTPLINVTLRPTFTPEVFVTVTPPPDATTFGLPGTPEPPTLTATADLRQPPLPPGLSVTVPASCSTFQLNPESSLSIKIRTPARLVWTGTKAASAYRVWLRHPDGIFILTQQKTDLFVELNQSLFNVAGVYAFEIVAFKGDDPVCQHLTGIIMVNR